MAGLFTEQVFDKQNFRETPLAKGEYEDCTFKNCDLSEADLSAVIFAESTFIDCNLSLAKLAKTTLRDVSFKGCKMLGLRFDTCSQFALSFSFEGCLLNHSSKKTTFKNTQLREVDFTACDLSACLFDNCDFLNATFFNAILEKADFRTSYNYTIDPETNKLKKAKFSLTGLPGLLSKYGIDVE
jgi:fluoroquinolone resistance protein